MELRSVEELMDLLHACRGVRHSPGPGGRRPGSRADLHEHALQTAALLRRGRPADKELQVAGLVHGIGRLLPPGGEPGHAERAADAVRSLLGERVAALIRLHAAPAHDAYPDDDLTALRQAADGAGAAGAAAGVVEDWRTVLELVAARNSRLGAVD
ncbi:hypothetical protein OK074_7966 [Actinobacteria bacterium OK074]|nr:hypothetical protein OK074_7966 [Actinobacteria bacterium OK074]